MIRLRCSSCRENITNQPGNVQMKCPGCGQSEIIRCKHCREISVPYKCPSCRFMGPN